MIGVVDRGPVRVVTLDRAAKRNALTVGMLGDLAAVFGVAYGARAVVLLGAGPVFCAGFDLRERVEGDSDGTETLRRQLSGLSAVIGAMRAGDAAVVVGVQGAAIAGGCALLGGADVVVADSGASLGYPVVRLGISPAVTAPHLRAAVGDGAMRPLLLDPTLIGAGRAREIGLVHEVVGTVEEVGPRAIAVGEALASKPGRAVAVTRAWLREIEEHGRGVGPDTGLAASLAAIDGDTAARLGARNK